MRMFFSGRDSAVADPSRNQTSLTRPPRPNSAPLVGRLRLSRGEVAQPERGSRLGTKRSWVYEPGAGPDSGASG